MMKDELIDNLNAKIERDRKFMTSVFNLLGINALQTLLTRFKYVELPDFTDVSPIKNFFRSFS